MPDEVLETLVARAFETGAETVYFAFQGGEPTLCGLPFYEKLIRLQEKYNKNGANVQNSLQTNGLLLDDGWGAIFGAKSFSGGPFHGRAEKASRPIPHRRKWRHILPGDGGG